MTTKPSSGEHTALIRGMNKGCLQLAVYVNYGMLTVHVIRGRQVKSAWNPLCSAFVRLSLLPDDMRRQWCRTDVVKETEHPFFDEKFSFELLEDDSRRRLYISVWHLEPQDNEEEFLGCMSFGLKHILRKSKKVDGWYYLLNEDIGQRKHLRVPVVSDVKPSAVSTDVGVHSPDAHETSLMRRNTSSAAVYYDKEPHNTSILRPPMRTAIHVGTTTHDGQESSFHKPMNRNVSFNMGPPLSPAMRGNMRTTSSLKPALRKSSSLVRSASCVSELSRPDHQPGQANVKRLNTYQSSSLDRRLRLKERDMNSFCEPPPYEDQDDEYDEGFERKRRCRDVTEDSDDNSAGSDGSIWIDTQTIVVRRTPSGGFGFSISGSRPARVCHVEPGSYAQQAGLRVDDQIMRINGFPVFASTTYDIANLVRYCKTSKLVMEIQRPYNAMDFFNVSSLSRQSSSNSIQNLAVEQFKVKRRKLKHFASHILSKHRRQKAPKDNKENVHMEALTSRLGFI